MAKKIVSGIMCLLITLSIFIAAINIETTNAQPPIIPLEGGATLQLFGAYGTLEVTGVITYDYPPLPPFDLSYLEGQQLTAFTSESTNGDPAWDIRVTGDGGFSVAIVGLPGEGLTEMWQIDLALGDVNYDGTVDCKDIQLIFRAWGSSPSSPRIWIWSRWNPDCDLNGDDRVNLLDLWIAYRNLGESAEWMPLEIVEVTDTMIYGETDHFSIFRGR